MITAEVSLDEELWPVVLSLDPDPKVARKVLSSALRLVTATDWVHDELTQALMHSGKHLKSMQRHGSEIQSVIFRRWMRLAQMSAKQRGFSLFDERQEGGHVFVRLF